jgi:hypothetical protein
VREGLAEGGASAEAGAVIDIWYSGFDGVYSAYGSGVCNPAEVDRKLGVPYAVVRYDKLCHRGGGMDSA